MGVDAYQAWETLQELLGHSMPPDAVSAFDLGLKRLLDARNAAYHGEVYAEPDELLALIDQVLARFAAVMGCVSPEWLEKLGERNGQLLSRLRGIETQVDTNWQVLIDYLRKNGPIELPAVVYVIAGRNDEAIGFLIGDWKKMPNSILAGISVPRSRATGLFASFLTKEQIDGRRLARRRTRLARHFENMVDLPKRDAPLLPLESGTMTVPATNAWLTVHLKGIDPHHLFLNATLADLHVQFPDAEHANGTLSGCLESPIVKGTTIPQKVGIEGVAQLLSEWHQDADASVSRPSLS